MARTVLDGLVSPFGVISEVRSELATPARGQVPLYWNSASTGSGHPGVGAAPDKFVQGAGCSVASDDDARLVALAEAAERYAGSDILGEPRRWATAEELAGHCLEPFRYPRCSEEEYADPDCPVVQFDPTSPIRWIEGLDLATSEPLWVPARMACYSLDPASQDECYVVSISTGYAVHTDPVEAVVRGMMEVIERDIIALLWLQQLPLPLMDEGLLSEASLALERWNWEAFVDTYVFDATSDLGVPSAFCVLAADADRDVCRVVGAGVGRDLPEAALRAVKEAISGRELLLNHKPEPAEDPADFKSLVGGMTYMARAERAPAFDFLLDGAEHRPRRPMIAPLPADPNEALATMVGTLTRARMRPVVVDRTTRELAAVGLTAVCVIVPDLQPMSPWPRAQFKGHDRLYAAPPLMGHRTLKETELNPWPQPFA
jgi:ribosomal protein S12 methylthiotransferase accessory factor